MTYSSPNHNARKLPVSMLVLHYTGMESADAALQRLCDPAAEVSAHYCIEEDGTLHQLVDEQHRTWHAGQGYWRGITDINSASIGIELVNPGHEFGYRPFPAAQLEACKKLCLEILARHDIPARNVVGHSDIAPTRKQDPGELFPWQEFAEAGIGVWPEVGGLDVKAPDVEAMGNGHAARGLYSSEQEQFLKSLAAYGYDVTDSDAAITAFHRHFVVDNMDKGADEISLQWASLLAKYS